MSEAAEDALDKQPAHLLPRGFASWDAFLLAQVDATVADLTQGGRRPLAQATWGEADRSHIGHVLSRVKGQTQTMLNTLGQAETRTRQMTRALKGVESLPDERVQALLPGGLAGEDTRPDA